MLDLHTHSTFSDGSDTPETLVAGATSARLAALALTDHDNTGGIPRFLAACRAQGLIGLSGVEISAEVPHGTLHILGYGVNANHPRLCEQLGYVLDGRAWRNQQILTKLKEQGAPLEWEEVAALAGEDVVGRPHFARAMCARGYVRTTQEAFDRFLAKGAPAYVDRFRLFPEDGIRLIREAGGLPVLAHPFTWEPDVDRLAEQIPALQQAGLAGLEVYYPEHTPEMQVAYLRLALQRGLLTTGGSDYHGASKPGLRLGCGFGTVHTPDTVLEPLLAALGPSVWTARPGDPGWGKGAAHG